MDYKKVRQTIDKIKKSIKKGKYNVYVECPNNIDECRAPDGRTFYKFVDMDDAKSSNDFGSCTVDVEGYSFSCEFNYGEKESDFFDEIEEEYKLEDGTIVTYASLVDEIVDAFNERNDIWLYQCTDMDSAMDMYAKVNKIKDPEYYWCEDEDCPVDIDDRWGYTAPKDLKIGTVYHERLKYYLVEEGFHENGEKLHAVHCQATCDDHGIFDTVLMTMKYSKNGKMKVIECEDCNDKYNSVQCYVEEES